ncbi:MAG: DUF3526 domain-containing protein [Pseudomonadota bacterium]
MTTSSLVREALHLSRDRAFIGWVLLTLLLSALAVAGGLREVQTQQETIERLLESDREDRLEALALHDDWGMAAYYSFHLTYHQPSDFAFAALGVRDSEPWKHRVRMLALEGQIYERDAGNPELALIGRFDFAFFAAFVLPVILIVILHDLQASERSAGRHALLLSTSGSTSSPWRTRALLRALAIVIAAVLPLLIGALSSRTEASVLFLAVAGIAAYLALWSVGAYLAARWERTSPVILASLLGTWVLLGIVGPAAGKLAVDRLVPIPEGADILLTQREAVNDAWDLPKEATMTPFVKEHPEWSDYAETEQSFEWKWYYAFQQVGDQRVAPISEAYRAGRVARDRAAGTLAMFAPPALLERYLQKLAGTDLAAHLAYEQRIRAFHRELRNYYYPKLFREEPYEAAALEKLPDFVSGS